MNFIPRAVVHNMQAKKHYLNCITDGGWGYEATYVASVDAIKHGIRSEVVECPEAE